MIEDRIRTALKKIIFYLITPNGNLRKTKFKLTIVRNSFNIHNVTRDLTFLGKF